MTRLNKYWTLFIVFLIVIIAIGSVVFWLRYSGSQPIELSISSEQEWQGRVYIDGAINNPGFYPVKGGDSLQNIIQAAGNTTNTADISNLKSTYPESGRKLNHRK